MGVREQVGSGAPFCHAPSAMGRASCACAGETGAKDRVQVLTTTRLEPVSCSCAPRLPETEPRSCGPMRVATPAETPCPEFEIKHRCEALGSGRSGFHFPQAGRLQGPPQRSLPLAPQQTPRPRVGLGVGGNSQSWILGGLAHRLAHCPGPCAGHPRVGDTEHGVWMCPASGCSARPRCPGLRDVSSTGCHQLGRVGEWTQLSWCGSDPGQAERSALEKILQELLGPLVP